MRKTKEEAAITRETLLQAALLVFSRKGYTAATLGDVAHQAGVTRGAIYWHFGSKAELYSALMNKYSARSGEIVQAAAAEGGSLVEILRRVFVRLLEAVDDDPALRAVMEISLFKTERTPELAAAQHQQMENSHRLLAGIAETMHQGITAGELRSDLDPADIGRAFIAFQNGALHLWLWDPAAFSLKDSAPRLAEIFLRGILPRGGEV
jgi:TetR/AcrR family acrAB operon transcriptional repressor